MRANELQQPRVNRRPDRIAVFALRRSAGHTGRLADLRHFLDWNFDAQGELLFLPCIDYNYSAVCHPERLRGTWAAGRSLEVSSCLPLAPKSLADARDDIKAT